MTAAQQQLVLGAREFVRSSTLAYCATHPGDFDEYHDAAMLAVCRAAEKYDPAEGTVFTTYAGRWVSGALADSQRFQFQHHRRHGSLGTRVPLDETIRASDRDRERAEARIDCDTILTRHLPKRHADMIRRRFDDVPGHVRAAESGYTLGSLYVTEHELVAKLKGVAGRDAARRRHAA